MNQAIQKKSKNSIKTMLQSEGFQDAIKQILPKYVTPERMARVAIAALTKTPKLATCTQESFVSAMMTLSQVGLEPDGRRAHLIPYGTTCQLIIDYKGIVELMHRTGLISNIHADVICENDDFVYNLGVVEKHKIDMFNPRGKMVGVYCIISFKDGSKKAEVMSKDDVDKIRARSKSANNGPWKTDYPEMAKKTVFKRASKWIPLGSNDKEQEASVTRVMDAIQIDNSDYQSIQEQKLESIRSKQGGQKQLPAEATPELIAEANENFDPDDETVPESDVDVDGIIGK